MTRRRSVMLLALGAGLLWAANAFADTTLRIITSSSIPPYVIAGENRGMVVDILRKAFAPEGYALDFSYAPNRRAESELAAHHVDAIYNLPCGSDGNLFYSQPIVDYHNVAVTLDSSHLAINGLADLKGKRVVAFQNAPLFLGTAFSDLVRSNPQYTEVSNQSLEVEMLYGHHADVVLLDERIFHYYLARSTLAKASRDGFVVHPLFPPAARCAAFIDVRVRDAGDRGLRRLHESGDFDRIVSGYDHTRQNP